MQEPCPCFPLPGLKVFFQERHLPRCFITCLKYLYTYLGKMNSKTVNSTRHVSQKGMPSPFSRGGNEDWRCRITYPRTCRKMWNSNTPLIGQRKGSVEVTDDRYSGKRKSRTVEKEPGAAVWPGQASPHPAALVYRGDHVLPGAPS